MKQVEVKLKLGMDKKGDRPGCSGERSFQLDYLPFALFWIFQNRMHRQLCVARLRQRVFEMPLPQPLFTAAMLNNQPMGFYNAATLVKTRRAETWPASETDRHYLFGLVLHA